MTSPKIDTVKKGGSRFYLNPLDPNDRVPGVTSVLNMLPKPFLRYWAAKVVAETAVDNAGTVVQMMLSGERNGAIEFLKKSPDRFTGKAADMGTEVHDLIDNKTTRSGVHEEVAIQMAAYINADYILHADGTTSPLPEMSGAAVLHLRPEQTQLIPVSVKPELFDAFKALLAVWEYDKEAKRGVIGKAIGTWKQ